MEPVLGMGSRFFLLDKLVQCTRRRQNVKATQTAKVGTDS